MASRVSDTTHSGTVHIADDQFAIIVSLLNKIAGNTPEAANAAIASVASKPTRPAPKPVPIPQHAPTVVPPPVVVPTPVSTPAAPGYKVPEPPKQVPESELSPAFGGPSKPEPTAASSHVMSFGEPFEPNKPAPLLGGAPKPNPKPEPKFVPSRDDFGPDNEPKF